MATLTLSQLRAKITQQRRDLAKVQRILFLASSTAHAEYVDRIFVRGEKADGSPIGEYSSDSYIKTRKEKGRQTGFVDLKLEGDLESDITASLQRTQTGFVSGTTRPINSRKVEGAIENYGEEVFKLSDRENDIFNDILRQEVTKVLNA